MRTIQQSEERLLGQRALRAVLAGVLVVIWALPALAAEKAAGKAAAAEKKSAAEKENPHVWKPRVKSVAVFKEDLGFFMREGKVSLRDGWCVSKQIPPAIFGTLAIYSHEEDRLVDIVGSGSGEVVDFDDVDAPKSIAAKRERLAACENLNIQLTYTKDTGKPLGPPGGLTAAGKLVSVGPKFVILQAASSNFAVPLDDVTSLKILDLPIRVHVTADGGDAPQESKLGMAYLRKGITWIPEYTLEILDDDTAQLTLRGTLVNQAEDLVHCDVNFVVGVPHFVHKAYLAPIAVGQVIRTIGAAVAPKQVRSQIAQRAAIVSNLQTRRFEVVNQPVGKVATAKSALGNLPTMAEPGGADYTVYTKKDMTVRRGEKAIVTLFRKKIKYSHVYRWSPPARMQHLLALQNSTDTAWTTGPCLVISGDRPLGEDLLKYVPRGGTGEIPVATAINIAHEKDESEIARKLKAHSPRSNYYLDLVTLKGEVLLKNFAKHEAPIFITVAVPGKPDEASDDGQTRSDPAKLQLLQRCGTIRWKIELAPGKKMKLNYSYQRYVPSH